MATGSNTEAAPPARLDHPQKEHASGDSLYTRIVAESGGRAQMGTALLGRFKGEDRSTAIEKLPNLTLEEGRGRERDDNPSRDGNTRERERDTHRIEPGSEEKEGGKRHEKHEKKPKQKPQETQREKNGFEYGYDKNGELNQIRQPDGSNLTRIDDTHWQKEFIDGSRSIEEMSVRLDKDGTLTYDRIVENGADIREVFDKSGTHAVYKALHDLNGPMSFRSQNLLLEHVENRDGTAAYMNYDVRGQLTSIETGTMELRKASDNNWYSVTPDGFHSYLGPNDAVTAIRGHGIAINTGKSHFFINETGIKGSL